MFRAPALTSGRLSSGMTEASAARSKLLRAAGLRRTEPRVAVLGVLETAKAPRSHAEVAEALEGAGFDKATVYRNLLALTEAGLVRRTDMGDRVWRFELVRDDERAHARTHPHFHCDVCGRVSCMDDVVVTLEGPRAEGLRGLQVQIRGTCEACQSPSSKARSSRRAAVSRR